MEVCPCFVKIYTPNDDKGICPWLLMDFFYLWCTIVVGAFFIIPGCCSTDLLLLLTTIVMAVPFVLSV